MKKLVATLLFISAYSAYANPNFTIGSNPFYTVFGFPHDILKWPSKGIFIYMNPQTLPWQGHVTNIDQRPNDTYISNYNNFEFPDPDNSNAAHSYMKASGYAYNNRYSFGGIWNFNELGKVYLELGTNRVNMDLEVDGIVRDNNTNETIPVTANTIANRRYYDFTIIYANYLFGNPFGFKLQYQDKSTDPPVSQVKFTRNGTEYVSNHLTWGWTTTPCAHIFRNPGETLSQNFDAWFLNDYTLYQGGQIDLQLSYEFDNFKSGIRYRRNSERGRYYEWRSDDTLAFSNFRGSYIWNGVDEREVANDMIRAYSKVRFFRIGDLDLGMLFFLQYADRDNNLVSANSSTNNLPRETDEEREITLEVNPWLNYKFEKSYFDFGLLFELSSTRMRNTASAWNGEQAVRGSYVYTDGFSPSWETFSQGKYFFFAAGFEANTSINVSGRFSALGSLLILRKYSFITKEYGDSQIPPGGNSYVFTKEYTREDYKTETWMSGFIGFSYGLGPIQTIATMQFPLAWLLVKQTKVTSSSATLVDLTQRNVWAVQQPISFRLLLVFGLER